MKKKVLLTGATGFLGSHLLERLLNDGFDVTILKRSFSNTKRIDKFLPKINAFDIDKISLEQIFQDSQFDIILHTATNYGRKDGKIADILNSNIVYPFELLQYAVQTKVKTFINVDTSLPRDFNLYSLSKKQFLDWLMFYNQKIQVINLKTEYFYGSGDENNKFVTMVIQHLFTDKDLPLSECSQLRDFIYIDDLINAFSLIINKINDFSLFEEFELGSGRAVSLKDIVNLCAKYVPESKAKLLFGKLPLRENEVMFSQADITRLQSLGWSAVYTLEKGIQQTIQLEKRK
jgi:nucleoside-diphosphate-sugar epimerase